MGKYPAYPEYKDSGIEWLGEIPAHWETKRLKHLATHNDEALAETTDPDYEIEYVEISGVDLVEGITSQENLIFENAPSRARRRVRDGDTIISTVRTYLKAIAAIRCPPDNLIVSTGFAVIRPKQHLDPDYVGYLLQSDGFVGDVVAHSVGVSYPAINASVLACLPVIEPPLQEQQAIARFLNHKTAQIDALIAKKEALLAKLAEKRTALISQAVTKGLDPSVPMKDSGIEWLGEIPAHWEVVPLMYLTQQNRPIMYGIVLPGPHADGGVPIVKGGDVAPGRLRLDLLNRTTHEIESRYVRSRLKEGDIVYAIRGSIGMAEIVPPQIAGANLTQDAARVAPNTDLNVKWLLYALKCPELFAQLDATAQGATIRGINIKSLKRLRVPVPPEAEQLQMVEFLDYTTAEVEATHTRIQQAIDKLKEYRTALITHAVTGKIDVRGAPIPAVGPTEGFG